jgi:Spy/CpxP family protein refolding chaperone
MAITALLAVAAGLAVPVWAQGGPGGYGMGGPGMGGHDMGGHGMGGHGMMAMGSPERLGRMTDHMLDGLKATDAQRTQIRQIAQAAASDLKAQREAGRTLRQKGLQLLAAPTVDAAAAEALRQQALAQHDQASKRMLQAMLDIAKVLTPEQRAKLGERLAQRSEMMQERQQRLQRGPAQKG